jgi:hypothetical protein
MLIWRYAGGRRDRLALLIVIGIVVLHAVNGNDGRVKNVPAKSGPVWCSERVGVFNTAMYDSERPISEKRVKDLFSDDCRFCPLRAVVDGFEASIYSPSGKNRTGKYFVASPSRSVRKLYSLAVSQQVNSDISRDILCGRPAAVYQCNWHEKGFTDRDGDLGRSSEGYANPRPFIQPKMFRSGCELFLGAVGLPFDFTKSIGRDDNVSNDGEQSTKSYKTFKHKPSVSRFPLVILGAIIGVYGWMKCYYGSSRLMAIWILLLCCGLVMFGYGFKLCLDVI